MSLMKLATYYRMLGDHVVFYKGNLNDLVLDDTYHRLLSQLYSNNQSIFWEKYKPDICKYLKRGRIDALEKIPLSQSDSLVAELFTYYRKYFRTQKYFEPQNRIYDIVCVTTLFTFYWDITIDTINFVKKLGKKTLVGGVMASILPKYVEEATGIKPIIGPLIRPGMLDPDNDIIVDSLPLDYSILHEIDYEYPANNGYYAYTTRGCVNHCAFCAVPILEPTYENFIPLAHQVKEAEARFGGKKDLLLLDNNVLASQEFDRVIDEIKKAGFSKGSIYHEPNLFEIAITNLKEGFNDRAYIKAIVKLYRSLFKKDNPKLQGLYNILSDNYLFNDYTATKENILKTYPIVKPHFEAIYSKKRGSLRYVDFNQGIDSRLVNDYNMARLAEIPVRPVRIAFDHWNLHKIYENAIRTAVRHGHTHLSNYVLYNFNEKPVELYWRLRLNVELGDELDVDIYSFPMKYHPITDPKFFSNRDYIGRFWNRKFIRAIQTILNVTKGKVGHGSSLFYKAFGKDENEYNKILYMPEAMILYRLYSERLGLTDKWWSAFSSLSEEQLARAKAIIETNVFSSYENKIKDPAVLHTLSFYRISKEQIESMAKNAGIYKARVRGSHEYSEGNE